MKDELNGILATMTGQPRDKVEADTERDYFMSAVEATEYGLIDMIFDRKADTGGAHEPS